MAYIFDYFSLLQKYIVIMYCTSIEYQSALKWIEERSYFLLGCHLVRLNIFQNVLKPKLSISSLPIHALRVVHRAIPIVWIIIKLLNLAATIYFYLCSATNLSFKCSLFFPHFPYVTYIFNLKEYSYFLLILILLSCFYLPELYYFSFSLFIFPFIILQLFLFIWMVRG